MKNDDKISDIYDEISRISKYLRVQTLLKISKEFYDKNDREKILQQYKGLLDKEDLAREKIYCKSDDPEINNKHSKSLKKAAENTRNFEKEYPLIVKLYKLSKRAEDQEW